MKIITNIFTNQISKTSKLQWNKTQNKVRLDKETSKILFLLTRNSKTKRRLIKIHQRPY